MSTMRIISESVFPPHIPETVPYATPITDATNVAKIPTANETRPP